MEKVKDDSASSQSEMRDLRIEIAATSWQNRSGSSKADTVVATICKSFASCSFSYPRTTVVKLKILNGKFQKKTIREFYTANCLEQLDKILPAQDVTHPCVQPFLAAQLPACQSRTIGPGLRATVVQWSESVFKLPSSYLIMPHSHNFYYSIVIIVLLHYQVLLISYCVNYKLTFIIGMHI